MYIIINLYLKALFLLNLLFNFIIIFFLKKKLLIKSLILIFKRFNYIKKIYFIF